MTASIKIFPVVTGLILITIPAAAQNPPLAFEVASVKPNKGDDTGYRLGCYFPNSIMVPKGMCTAVCSAILKPAAEGGRKRIHAFGSAPTDLEATNSSMADLAQFLSHSFHMPFSDQTGLEGRFDFKLTFIYDAPAMPNVPLEPGARMVMPLNDSALPAIAGALPKQLGLRLRSEKVPLRLLVINHAEKPDEN